VKARAPEQQLAPWFGPYLGFNIGYAWAQDPSLGCDFSGASPCQRDTVFPVPRAKGVLGGGLAGYNWQVGTWVFGLEGDINALAVKDSAHFPGIDPSKGPDRISSQYDWLGTVRGRAGYSTSQVLFYGTGGFAVGGVRHAYDFAIGNSTWEQSASSTQTRTGWTAGGGVEVALAANVSFKVEYLYVHLQHSSLDLSGINFDSGPHRTVFDFSNNLNVVRAGLNFRF
jgi:outer membrane immunogenic protein